MSYIHSGYYIMNVAQGCVALTNYYNANAEHRQISSNANSCVYKLLVYLGNKTNVERKRVDSAHIYLKQYCCALCQTRLRSHRVDTIVRTQESGPTCHAVQGYRPDRQPSPPDKIHQMFKFRYINQHRNEN